MPLSIADLPWLPSAPGDWTARCKEVGTGEGHTGASLKLLANYRLDSRQSLALARALERLRKSGAEIAPLSEFRFGILASNTVDLLIDCLPAACIRHGVAPKVVSAPYDQVIQQALDPA